MLVALIDGVRIGAVYQGTSGTLRFVYLPEWRESPVAHPLSLSMPLTAMEHRHETTSAFLWGLLPDNAHTLDRYGRLFGVSPRNPVALLAHIGADCAGAVQFASPETAERLEGVPPTDGDVEWITEEEIATELKSVRERGIAGTSRTTVGQFSLAGAQPKIALLEEHGRWGRPSGRIPTNRILKPPSGEFRGFAENEHFCLELAGALGLGAVSSRVMHFAGEPAIVVERFDRTFRDGLRRRIHQEDMCQALGVMPTLKYQSEGGPGIPEIIALLREASTQPDEDVDRFLRATALNWIIAATDAHAKNYALLHGRRGVRLAPFYDILSYLPYAEEKLYRVKSAMKVGSDYEIRRIDRDSWSELARRSRLGERRVIDNVMQVLELLPDAVDRVAAQAIMEGLEAQVIDELRDRVGQRIAECAGPMRQPGGLPAA